MIYALICTSICLIGSLIAVGILFYKNKTLQHQLKELLQENEAKQNPAKDKKSDDIVFKTDKDLVLTYVSESLCKQLGYKEKELIGKSIFGTIMEDTDAIQSHVHGYTGKILKKSRIVNNNIVLRDAEKQNLLMQCHQRPILNEILECTGISFICKNISQTQELQNKLDEIKDKDVLTGALNQESFLSFLEKDFQRAKRYNQNFALLVLETKDLCKFINQGISFERGDKLLKEMYKLCMDKTQNKAFVGRFEKTKFGIILNDYTREKAAALAQEIYEASKPIIKKLGVDDYNAQMLILSHTECKGFTDTYDNMIERINRHIKNALRRHQYGVMTSDNDKKWLNLPRFYKKDE